MIVRYTGPQATLANERNHKMTQAVIVDAVRIDRI